MTYPTILEASGAESATGLAKETTFGTAVAADTFLPMTGNTMEVEPGWFSPTLMQGLRDKQIYNLQGEEKHAGAIDGPLYPSNAMALLVASVGVDGTAGYGVVGTAGTGSSTLSGATTAGATTVSVVSATGFTVGQVVQVDVNAPAGTPVTTAECRKITTIATNTLTLDQALTYAHASGATVAGVVAPYTHTIQQANTLPSLTVEKNIGGRQSLQWAGCRVNKFDLKAPVGNEPVAVTADIMAQSVTPLSTPTAVSVTNELPFVFAEASVSFYGTNRTEAANAVVSIDNAIKETYTYSGNHGPSFLTPTTLHVSGTLDMVWSSLTDATYGDFNRMYNQTLGALTVTLTHPSSAGTVTLTMPQIALSKYANDLKAEDVVMSSMSWEASRPQSGTSQFTVQATIENSAYLPY